MVTATLNANAGAGYAIDCDADGCGRITVKCVGETYVKFSTDPEAVAPVATPAPAAGAVTDYLQIEAGGRADLDLNQGVITPNAPRNTPIRKILIWAVGAGLIKAMGN